MLDSTIVTSIMFAIYVIFLSLLLRKVSTIRKLIPLITAAGLGLGLGILSAMVAGVFSSIEVYFMHMNNQGKLRILLVGPVQEEIAKFVCFILAYGCIMQLSRLSGEEKSKIENVKSLIVLGAMVGLVFALLENLNSYGNLTTLGTLGRTVLDWPLHMIEVGISACGFHIYKKYKNTSLLWGIEIIIIFLLLAIVIHCLFNRLVTF